MKRKMVLLLLALSLILCFFESPVLAGSTTGPRTVVPEGVTEIDLRTVLGDDVLGVSDVWMLNADTCVIARELPEVEVHGLDNVAFICEAYEVIVLDTRDLSILSRTPVPHVGYIVGQNWEDGAFYLLFEPANTIFFDTGYHHTYDPEITYIKATIAEDGMVIFDNASSKLTIMPGGKTAIREALYGSLYAVDLATGEEDLLIQGTAGPFGTVNYEAYLKYVPFRDDAGYDGADPWGSPLPTTFPLDEDSFDDISQEFYRGFYVYKPLDEHRFVYEAYCWEWGAGFGVYDLKTRADHRITGRGHLFGLRGSTLYGATLKADANIYESTPLPKAVQELLDGYGSDLAYDISPDGKLLVLVWRYETTTTITVYDFRTGNLLKTYTIDTKFAYDDSINFYDDTHLLLFDTTLENDSACIYLIDVEE